MSASLVIDYINPTANLVKEKDCYLLKIAMADGNYVVLHFHKIEDLHSFVRIMNLVVEDANK